MRCKNHHLIQRGKVWSLVYTIPADLLPEGSRQVTKKETLKTTDVVLARKRRDQRLRELEREWTLARMGLRQRSPSPTGDIDTLDYALAVARENDPVAASEYTGDIADIMEDNTPYPSGRGLGPPDYERAQKEFLSSPAGQRLRNLQLVAQGKRTPIAPIADRWLTTKNLAPKTIADHKTAIRILTERFTFIEEVDYAAASEFLSALLREKARPTVQRYTQAFRGIWRHAGRLDGDTLWTVKGLKSRIPTIRPEHWTPAEYLTLLDGACHVARRGKGDRQLFLLIRIAAHTGASLSGIVGMELRENYEGSGVLGLYLPEMKTEGRARTIPCHPAIEADVREWVALRSKGKIASTPDERSHPLSKRFTRLKQKLGFGKEKKLHGFRHSVSHQLENAGVSERAIARLLGHKTGRITSDVYNPAGLTFSNLKVVVEKISWPAYPPVAA